MGLSLPDIKTAACTISLVEFGRVGGGGHEFHFGCIEFEMSLDIQGEMSTGSSPGSGVWKRSLGWRYIFGACWHLYDV